MRIPVTPAGTQKKPVLQCLLPAFRIPLPIGAKYSWKITGAQNQRLYGQKAAPVFEKNAGIISFVGLCAEVLQRVTAVPGFQQLYQQAVDMSFPVKFLGGEEIPAANILRHTLLKPDAALLPALEIIQKPFAVMGKLMPQNGENAVFIDGALIEGTDLCRGGTGKAVQLAQVYVPPDREGRAEYHPVLVGVGGNRNAAKQLRGGFAAGPDDGSGQFLDGVFLPEKPEAGIQPGLHPCGKSLIVPQLRLGFHSVQVPHGLLLPPLLALLLAWGKNFMGFTELAFKILPGYAKFRTVSMALVIVEWSVPVLAALALRELHRTTLGWRQTAARVAACAGALVVLSLAALALTDGFDTERSINLIRMLVGDSPAAYELRDALTADRRALLTADVWRTVGFVAATAAVITAYAWLRSREWVGPAMRRLLPYAMTVAVGALAVWDLAGVDRRFFNDGNFVDKTMTRIEPSAADRAIMNDTDLGFRVINLDVDPFNDATTSYFHRSVGGYHGAKLGRYQDLIDRYTDVCDGRRSLHPAILAMLDCRYAIYNGQAETLADKCGVEPLGAAWFVSSVRREASAAEQLEALSKVDLATTAVVDADALPGGGEYDAAGEIRLAEYRPNYLRYEYDSEGDALAVFSEIYFPDGWTATIDGAEAPYLRADYTLRAMELPAGRHTVEWRFRAPAWRTVEAVTLISSIAVLAACAAAAAAWIIRLIRRSRHE